MSESTRFGFDFGSFKVERTAMHRGVALISIATPKSKISIRSTPTGFIKFYDSNGEECELVNKKYIEQLENKGG